MADVGPVRITVALDDAAPDLMAIVTAAQVYQLTVRAFDESPNVMHLVDMHEAQKALFAAIDHVFKPGEPHDGTK